MNNSNNKDVTSGIAGIVAIILFVAGVAFNQLPIEITRPKGAEMKSLEVKSLQDVEARLWQDPFSAVKNHRELESKKNIWERLEKIEEHQIKALQDKIDEHLTKEENNTITVLGVMVNGGPYAEYAEQRRRMRYAVLAGLANEHYVPEDSEHIGYIHYIQESNNDSPKLPEIIPFEWIISFDREKRNHKILVLWIAEDNFRDDPYGKLLSLFDSLKCTNCNTNTNNYKIKVLGPFNSFVLRKITDEKSNEIDKIELIRLNHRLKYYHDPNIDIEFYSATTTVRTRFILGRLAKDNVLERCKEYKGDEKENEDKDKENLKCIFNDRLFRTIHSDYELAKTLIKELNERNIEPGRDKILLLSEWDTLYGQYLPRTIERVMCEPHLEFKTNNNPAEIIHEFETKFKLEKKESPVLIIHAPNDLEKWTIAMFNKEGKFLGPKDVIDNDELLNELKNKSRNECKILNLATSELNDTQNKSYFAETLLRYTYLRGLDGDIPASKNGEDKQDKQKDQTATDQQLSKERPEGTGQFDYIRRLADKIAGDIEDNNRKGKFKLFGDESRVKAIGILGSDVHDKLILLQALRPKLPNMIFFTTDMDARLIPPGSHDWGRNLIVASSFGLNLNDNFQRGIPPFRSVYQTSTFLATQLAVCDIGCDFRSMDASDDNPKDKIISNFKIELESKKRECVVLIVHVPGDSGKWTVAGFNDKGEFREIPIDPNHELSKELEKKTRNKRRIVELATSNLGRTNIETIVREAKHTLLDEWLKEPPRLFEIGRTEAFDITDTNPIGEQEREQVCSLVEKISQQKISINEIPKLNPSIPPLFPREKVIVIFTIILFLILLIILVTLNNHPWDTIKSIFDSFPTLLIIIPLCLIIILSCVIIYITINCEISEPLLWFQGISIWPTQIIRSLTVMLSSCFLMYSWRIIKKDQENLGGNFFSYGKESTYLKNSKTGTNIFYFKKLKDESLPAKMLFNRYLLKSRPYYRLIRTFILFALFSISFFFLFRLFPMPDPPARGQITFIINRGFLFVSIPLFWLLLFFITDAFRCSEQFLHDMTLHTTEWSGNLINRYTQQLKIPDSRPNANKQSDKLNIENLIRTNNDLVNDWLEVEVAATHTESISKLIRYPFIILILLIFALNHFFDNWAFPWSLGIVITFAFIVLIFYAWRLQRAAQKLRSNALDHLYKKLIWAEGDKRLGAVAAQLKLLIEQINNLKRGAFQSFLQRPLPKSILALLGSWGVLQLLQYFYR